MGLLIERELQYIKDELANPDRVLRRADDNRHRCGAGRDCNTVR